MYNTLDFCGANIYASPFPGSNDTILNKQTLINQFNEIFLILGNKLWITETGIPHAGGKSDGTSFNRNMQKDLINEVILWHNINN